MDISKAKFFVLHDLHDDSIIYTSKDLQSLVDKAEGLVSVIKAVVETDGGKIMFDMDIDYCDEPIIMQRFMHYETYKSLNSRNKFIVL